MPSNPQLKLMTDLLKIDGVSVIKYQVIEEIGIVLHLEKTEKAAICTYCGAKGEKLHQNNWLTVRDLPWGEQTVYLRINRRQMRCDKCGKKYTEELEYIKKKRNHTERFKRKIIEEVLTSDIKNVGKRNGVSEQEIETMLKDLAKELIKEKPEQIEKLGIDEIAVVKGQKNYYVVLVAIERKKIIGMLEKRTEEELKTHLEAYGQEFLESIKEVSIDLWKPYKKVAELVIPQAEIVADRFHVMKQVNQELNTAIKNLKRATKSLKNEAEKSLILSGLAHSKYALLKNEEELTEKPVEATKGVTKQTV